eukprot:m.20551 g.20551  ORF g.20551 m.20551 type:complete len:220 (+) comp3802_c0_seq1:86-745(+)
MVLATWLSLAALAVSESPAPANTLRPRAQPNILIVYYTHTGYTGQLANAIASGVRTVLPTTNVKTQHINETDVERDLLAWADGILVGSPTYFGNPAGTLKTWVDEAWEPYWTDPRFGTKFGAAFATGGGMAQGVEHTNSCIHRILESFRVTVIDPDPTRSGYASYGPVAVTGTYPFNGTELDTAWVTAGATFGAKFANVVHQKVNERHLLASCQQHEEE